MSGSLPPYAAARVREPELEKLQGAESTLAVNDRVKTLTADITQESEIVRLFDDVRAFEHLVATA